MIDILREVEIAGPDRKILDSSRKEYSCLMGEDISSFHGCMVWIEKSVTRVLGRHHESCQMMPNSDPE